MAAFFGISMIMVGKRPSGNLLGGRAAMEGFATFSTGLIMSMCYVGFNVMHEAIEHDSHLKYNEN
jgi:hypothetical protein